MKLIFDENLSPRLPELLGHLFPGSLHVREVQLQAAPDLETWEYAKKIEAAIVPKTTTFIR